MRKKENNFAFIDSQNLNLGIRDQGWELDFGRFRVYLRDKYHIALMVPNRKKYSGLLKRKDFLPYTRFAVDNRNKVQKKKDPNKDKTLSGHSFCS